MSVVLSMQDVGPWRKQLTVEVPARDQDETIQVPEPQLRRVEVGDEPHRVSPP